MVAGANAIPVDIFHSKSTAAAMRQLVDNAVDANMNMIRVWGGGMYYRDDFYDYTDRAGLLVWQEAMFACSLYPANTAFLADVSASASLPLPFSMREDASGVQACCTWLVKVCRVPTNLHSEGFNDRSASFIVMHADEMDLSSQQQLPSAN